MVSILCPHCGTKQSVNESQRGAIFCCVDCGKEMTLAIQPTAVAVADVSSELAIDTKSVSLAPRRRRQRARQVIRWTLHLAIFAATIYAGSYLLNRPSSPPPASQAAGKDPTTTPQHRQPLRSSPTDEPAQADEPLPPRGPVRVYSAPPEAAPSDVTSPFQDWPQQLELPSLEDDSIVVLADPMESVDYTLVSIDPALQQRGQHVVWWNGKSARTERVAGLAVVDGVLKFRWLPPVSGVAEVAMRTAMLQFTSAGHEHRLCLRQPQLVEPLQIDLKKTVQHITCRCTALPAAEAIHFELLTATTVPTFSLLSAEGRRLRIREECLLRYTGSGGVITRLLSKRHGSAIAVEVENRFKLPSGDEQPLTLAAGEAKLRELTALRDKLATTEKSIGGLRGELKNQQAAANRLAQKPNKTTKDVNQLAVLGQRIAGLNQQVGFAERLLAQKSAINDDYHALEAIGRLAKQLQGKLVQYRYFVVVAGHDIDLVRSDLSPRIASKAQPKP